MLRPLKPPTLTPDTRGVSLAHYHTVHIKPSNIGTVMDHYDHHVTIFKLPHMECSKTSEDIYCAAQDVEIPEHPSMRIARVSILGNYYHTLILLRSLITYLFSCCPHFRYLGSISSYISTCIYTVWAHNLFSSRRFCVWSFRLQTAVCTATARFSHRKGHLWAKNYLIINTPLVNGHLFAYTHSGSHWPVTKCTFLNHINTMGSSLGLDSLMGHGVHIGGTLEYLLWGLPFDVVKSMGHWPSDTFTLYLCKHAVIMAPYLQNSPVLDAFMHYTMPLIWQC